MKRHIDLEIAFQTRELRRVCERQVSIYEELGEADGERFQRRLDDIQAASKVTELLPMFVTFCKNAHFRLNFAPDKDILLKANHVDNPTDANGNIDWGKVNRVKIVSIGGKKYDS